MHDWEIWGVERILPSSIGCFHKCLTPSHSPSPWNVPLVSHLPLLIVDCHFKKRWFYNLPGALQDRPPFSAHSSLELTWNHHLLPYQDHFQHHHHHDHTTLSNIPLKSSQCLSRSKTIRYLGLQSTVQKEQNWNPALTNWIVNSCLISLNSIQWGPYFENLLIISILNQNYFCFIWFRRTNLKFQITFSIEKNNLNQSTCFQNPHWPQQ